MWTTMMEMQMDGIWNMNKDLTFQEHVLFYGHKPKQKNWFKFANMKSDIDKAYELWSL
jgi:hypothetical protein